MTKVTINDSQELPVCPHCGKAIEKINKQQVGQQQVHIIYFCSNCKKIINIVAELSGY